MAQTKVRFDRAVEGATNIVDSGTEGTKVAAGTTAQRGSTAGQWRYNTTTGFFEGRNASTFSTLEPTPAVNSVDVTDVDSGAGGSQTFVITGTDFSSGGTIAFVANDQSEFNADTTTFNSTTQVTAVKTRSSFLNAKEPYKIKFTSASGKAGVSGSGLVSVDTAPTWNTAAGNLGNIYHDINANHFTLSATDAEGDAIVYSETGGTNISGAGLSLSNGGVISGNANDVSSDTTVSFTGRATANGKNVDRSFSFVVKPSLGSSTNPATSAKQLYDAGYTTNGLYYFNNFLTGSQTKQAYARFDVKDSLNTNKLHLQRIDIGHLSAHAIRTYANSGSNSLTRTAGNATDLDVDNGSTFTYSASSSTGAGASGVIDTGLTLSQFHGYTLLFEVHQTSTGDGGNTISYGFDFSSNTNGGNYGNNYVPDIYLGQTKTQEVKFYLHAINFAADGSATSVQKNVLGGQYRHTSNSTVWSNFYSDSGDKTDVNNSNQSVNATQTAEYLGVRFAGWADHTSAKTGHIAMWAGITGS